MLAAITSICCVVVKRSSEVHASAPSSNETAGKHSRHAQYLVSTITGTSPTGFHRPTRFRWARPKARASP